MKSSLSILALALSLISCTTTPDEGKQQIEIEVNPATQQEQDKLSATAFGVSLAHYYSTSREIENQPRGIVVPSFKALIHAYENQIQVWSGLSKKESRESVYMNEITLIQDNTFLHQYVWVFHRMPNWSNSERPERIEEFESWFAEKMPNHSPRIEARLRVR